ncbi:tripartite tricarboxylate transporter TctB family protein [Salibaculum griseiflavum]|jgi:putative tricarboxylic transport membrane protein|uniref:Tripartite tricarboxylate transporter TctB family protein n=1 Tax=Salibaculum griseiflavum TaxID=1914409 RepID=A0A2V1P801_9RHOB|nr:tripartite tricarboxylate transporter TctB family protein [Salibaculum griseiflavum]PWG17930.1 tripartite tricarboxylate transporter TctB family protein [Salibaculum griseiflavum]
MLKSDRIFGVVVVLGAFAYIASALQTPTSFMSDPVGPKTFPVLLGAVAGLCGLIMVLKPDEEPDWPDFGAVIALAISVVVLIGYAYALKPLGFLIPTAITAGILSYQITPRPLASALTGLGLSVGLFLLFKYVLGLGLVPFPKGWFG